MADTGFRSATDGTRLFTHRWRATEPRASVVLVHGLGEHLGRYDHVGDALAARGYDVRGSDLRGFGASEGARAWVDSFDTYLDDMSGDLDAAHRSGVPVVLLGHSVGGLLALLYTQAQHRQPDFLVLSSPALRNTLPRWKIIAVRALAPVLPRLTIGNPVDLEQLSRDQTVGERYAADPLVLQRSSIGMGAAAFRAFDRVPAVIDRLTKPTLVIHGAADRIVAPDVSEQVRGSSVDRTVFPEFRHESFNEEGGTAAIEAVSSWIERQLATAE